MKDIINSFKAHLYERTSSPLVGSFIFYWLICNYKIVVVLFDEKLKSQEKFDTISKLYENDFISVFTLFNISITGLILPLAITLAYILLLPFISNTIHKVWIWHQNKLKEISNGKVLTKKEFGDLQRRFTELELSFDDTFSKKDTEITTLKSIIDEKDGLILDYQDKIENYKENTTNLETQIIELEQIKQKIDNQETEAKLALVDNLRLIKSNHELDKQLKSIESQLKDVPKLNDIIDTLKTENSQYKEKLETINNSIKMNKKLGYSEDEISILKLIGNSKGTYPDTIQNSLKLHRIKVEKACKKLLNSGFIMPFEYKEKYIITEDGQDFLLNNNLI